MKASIWTGLFLFVLGVVLAMAQLWLAPWSPGTFLKIELTVAAALLVVIVVFYIVRESREDDATRSGNRLDE
ncbi:MAG TPA: hypothetical protein VIU46_04610 [Gallionellaceae bacterium]